MNTQVKIADYITEQGAYFHLTVKGNQANLLEAVQTWHRLEVESRKLKPDFAEDLEKGHGRITQRRIWITDRLNDYIEFPHVKLVFAVQRIVIDPKGKTPERCEVAFGVTSLSKEQTSAQQVLSVNRNHWAVEAAHKVLDDPHAFDEDASQISCGHGPENMAGIRRFALTVLRHYQKSNGQPITEQLRRLGYKPRRVLEYLRLVGNTRPRAKPKRLSRQWLLTA